MGLGLHASLLHLMSPALPLISMADPHLHSLTHTTPRCSLMSLMPSWRAWPARRGARGASRRSAWCTSRRAVAATASTSRGWSRQAGAVGGAAPLPARLSCGARLNPRPASPRFDSPPAGPALTPTAHSTPPKDAAPAGQRCHQPRRRRLHQGAAPPAPCSANRPAAAGAAPPALPAAPKPPRRGTRSSLTRPRRPCPFRGIFLRAGPAG